MPEQIIPFVCLRCPKCGGADIRTIRSELIGRFRVRRHICQTPLRNPPRDAAKICGHKFRSQQQEVF